jgi:hypothetical protein
MKKIHIITNKEIIRNFISLFVKTFLLIVFTCHIVLQLNDRTITPVKVTITKPYDKVEEIKQDLQHLVPDLKNQKTFLTDVSKSIKIASDVTNINDKLITSIAFYESRMNKNAISSAGYKGIMQATRHDVYEFAEVDILRGAKKLETWIKYRNGNLRYALASYNGGTYPPTSSYGYADKVIQLSRKLEKRRIRI